MSVVTIGVDLAKTVFQVHGVDAAGVTVLRRKLARADMIAFFTKQPSCIVGMEACSSAHHWARLLVDLGHTVRLIPPQYVKPEASRVFRRLRTVRRSIRYEQDGKQIFA